MRILETTIDDDDPKITTETKFLVVRINPSAHPDRRVLILETWSEGEEEGAHAAAREHAENEAMRADSSPWKAPKGTTFGVYRKVTTIELSAIAGYGARE